MAARHTPGSCPGRVVLFWIGTEVQQQSAERKISELGQKLGKICAAAHTHTHTHTRTHTHKGGPMFTCMYIYEYTSLLAIYVRTNECIPHPEPRIAGSLFGSNRVPLTSRCPRLKTRKANYTNPIQEVHNPQDHRVRNVCPNVKNLEH